MFSSSSWKKPIRYGLETLALLAVVILLSACTYRYYLGMHGPSIQQYPSIHAKLVDDTTCLMCHAPGTSALSPKTSHPKFKNCLKCHNDDIRHETFDRSDKAMENSSMRPEE